MQTLAQIKAILAAHGLRPKHRFGQNFLHDAGKFELILQAAELSAGDVVLEVGPGTGALTDHLLERGAQVVAVEIDHDLQPILRERYASYGARFQLVAADVLAGKHAINPEVVTAVTRMCAAQGRSTWKLIANLPYNVASPLLVNLAVDHPGMTLGVVMVQREVAERLTAGEGGKDYGPLSVMVQALCETRRIGLLPPGCFWPPPEVDSAIVRLQRRGQPLTNDPARLAELTHRLFSKRRKQIGAILGRTTPLPAGIDGQARPEQLRIAQLVELAQWVPTAPDDSRG